MTKVYTKKTDIETGAVTFEVSEVVSSTDTITYTIEGIDSEIALYQARIDNLNLIKTNLLVLK